MAESRIPSANGHGTAKSLARLFGILSTGCKRNGKILLNEKTLIESIKPISNGPDTVLFGADVNFGVGLTLGWNNHHCFPKHPASLLATVDRGQWRSVT